MRWILAGVLTVTLTVAGAVWIGRPRPLHLELPSSVVEQATATGVLNPDRIRAHVTRLAGAPSRVSGYPGADLAARTILDELDSMGLTNREVQAFTVVVPIVRSASLTATGGPDGQVSIPLHPLWPNLARTCATGPEGITAPLVSVGRGKDADLAGKVLRGAIMVMDWQSNTEWLSVPEFAGQAVIFRASPGTAGILARNKFLTVPAHIPRFYVEERDLPLLDRVLAAGASQVTVRCEMDWEEVGARNILARVCGGDTPRGNEDTDRAPVVFHAYYDSISVVPDLAPGAEQACSPAVLLELARFLSNLPNKPNRPVYVLFTGGHGQALSGMTCFIRRLQEGLDHGGKDAGADALIARMGRPALFVGLDLASHSDRFGVFAFGNFRGYADWILRPKFSALGLKLDEFAKQQCPLFDPAADLPGFVDAINSSQGRGWNTYFPYPPAFESELPILIGIPGITLATINDDRKLVDTPDDRLENVNFDLLGRQLVPEPGKRLGLPAFALALSFWKGPFVAQAIDPKLARVRGQVLWLDQKQDYTPRQPLAKALVFLQANRSDKQLLGTRGPCVTLSDADGRFEFDGLLDCTGNWQFRACRLEAYGLASREFVAANRAGIGEYHKIRARGGQDTTGLDLDGSIIYAVDMANQACRPFDILPGDQDLNLVVFPCKTITLYGLTDPRGYLPLTDLQILELATQSPPFQYGQSKTADAWGTPEANCMTLWADPTIRVRLTLGLGFREKRLVLLNNTVAKPVGAGFVLSELDNIPSMILQGARDMWNLDESRIRKFEANGVNTPMIRKIHAQTATFMRNAEAALQNADYRGYRDMSERLWSLESKAYIELLSMTNNMIKGVIFYLALLLPFSYALERLLFAFGTVRRRIIGMTAIFAGSFTILALIHPAFRFTMTPMIVLLAFVILALAVTVMCLLIGKFDTLLTQRKQALGGVHEDAPNTGSITIRALDLGIANIRRRPQRGFLTAMTLVLVTFTLLSFTSIVSDAGISSLRHPTGKPVYRGLLTRQRNWTTMPLLAYDSLTRSFQGGLATGATNGNVVAGRGWFYSDEAGKLSQVDLVRTGAGQDAADAQNDHFSAVALLGMTPAEPAVTGVDRALVAGRWFADEHENGIILPRHIAKFLGLGPGKLGSQVLVYGHELPLIGILDEKVFDQLLDLDGEPLTPVNFVVQTQMGGDAPASAREKSDTLQEYAHYSLDQIAIVPLAFVRQLGAGIRSVAVKTGSSVDPVAAACDYTRRSNQAVLASDGRTVTLFASVNTQDFAAAGQIAVPVLLGFLMVLGTMLGSVYERRREIFVYNSVGLSPTNVASLFLAESTVYAILGAGIGYLLGQMVARFLLATGTLSGLSLNYSAGTTVLTTVFTMLLVLLSTIYPARQAFLAAMPPRVHETDAGAAGQPAADTVEFFLPFVATPANLFAMQAYMHEYLDSIQGVTIGQLAVDNLSCHLETTGGKPVPALRFRAWLAPFDLGVSHDTELRIAYRDDRNLYQYQLRVTRHSGDQQNWRRLLPRFTTTIRKQLLLWRIIQADALPRYRHTGQTLFGMTP